MKITFEDIRANEAVQTYIKKADESLTALGYTEHSFPHVMKVAKTASDILLQLGYSEREAELARITEAFYRVDKSRSRQSGGSGLGLAIVRAAAANHGGTLLISTGNETGMKVTLTVALRQDTGTTLRSPLLCPDYTGGWDHGLVELSDCLDPKYYCEL